MSFSATVQAATPATRDRYVDLLRVTSLGVVILGHWLMAVVLIDPAGEVSSTNVLAVVPSLQPLTWLLQVMPVFFLVGGFSHAVALASQRRRAGSYADFVRSRAGRLLRPTAAFVAVWLLLALLLELTGRDEGV
ncbi:MAG TPA: acyltransferase family protein, partial [Micromonosporaceae bacterium]|nr:acyltransferase family protein [Micromonosporaceae bacterium]